MGTPVNFGINMNLGSFLGFALAIASLTHQVIGCCEGNSCSCEPNCWERCFNDPPNSPTMGQLTCWMPMFLDPQPQRLSRHTSIREIWQASLAKFSLLGMTAILSASVNFTKTMHTMYGAGLASPGARYLTTSILLG